MLTNPDDFVLNTRARVGTAENGDSVFAQVEITLELNGQMFQVLLPTDVVIDMAYKLLRTAYYTQSDAILIEAMHKAGIPKDQITQATTLSRLKRSAGTG